MANYREFYNTPSLMRNDGSRGCRLLVTKLKSRRDRLAYVLSVLSVQQSAHLYEVARIEICFKAVLEVLHIGNLTQEVGNLSWKRKSGLPGLKA